jgi:hypothetical protein
MWRIELQRRYYTTVVLGQFVHAENIFGTE